MSFFHLLWLRPSPLLNVSRPSSAEITGGCIRIQWLYFSGFSEVVGCEHACCFVLMICTRTLCQLLWFKIRCVGDDSLSRMFCCMLQGNPQTHDASWNVLVLTFFFVYTAKSHINISLCRNIYVNKRKGKRKRRNMSVSVNGMCSLVTASRFNLSLKLKKKTLKMQCIA